MNTRIKHLLFIILVLNSSLFANSIEIPQKIITGLKQGNVELISEYFNDNIELTINSKENVYSSTQAKIILKDFFKKNKALDFKILHQGGKTESKYAIGSLKTVQGNFRITILLKLDNTTPYIHQLRIEKDDI